MAENVWYCIPSARPVAEAQRCVDAWRDMGYSVCIGRDSDDGIRANMVAQFDQYGGYAKATNSLIELAGAANADWFVIGGDDVFPDPTKRAEEIARECRARMWNYFGGKREAETKCVMQPTGDGHGIETICGSPWIGREAVAAIKQHYGGVGPLWPEYTHCFVDNELQDLAIKLGIFWQRPDLTHRHEHWSWTGKPMPGFLAEANSPAHWQKYQALYLRRKAAGFPGVLPMDMPHCGLCFRDLSEGRCAVCADGGRPKFPGVAIQALIEQADEELLNGHSADIEPKGLLS